MSIINNKTKKQQRQTRPPASACHDGHVGQVATRSGQIMLIVSIMIGVLTLSVSTIAGLLMFFELQGSNDAASSAMAVFAADSGIEASLYCYYHGGDIFSKIEQERICKEGKTFSNNGASYSSEIWCVGSDTKTEISCSNSENVYGFRVKSIGNAQKTERILESFYATRFN